MEPLAKFLRNAPRHRGRPQPAVSLFSNAGIGDYGYTLAGFDFLVHAELHAARCDILSSNYEGSDIVQGDLHETWPRVVQTYRESTSERLALLAASPPCQGMSTANQRAGANGNSWRYEVRADDRNYLYDVIPKVTEALRPRVVIVENVPGILVTGVKARGNGRTETIAQALRARMPEYRETVVTLQMADFGIPQQRLRTFFILVDETEPWFGDLVTRNRLPFPAPTHGVGTKKPWIPLGRFLRAMKYPALDGVSVDAARDEKDPLHFVPVYDKIRYGWIERNPPLEGRSCFDNLACTFCGHDNSPGLTARCRSCRRVLRGIPRITTETNHIRPVRGRKTAYKRMRPDHPAATVTTASGHLGSDNTIHPWENRVLSIRECADLQAIPRSFRISARKRVPADLSRTVIGEAIPPYFTYRLGRVVRNLLLGLPVSDESLLERGSTAEVHLDRPLVAPITGSRPAMPWLLPALNGSNGASTVTAESPRNSFAKDTPTPSRGDEDS